MLYSQNQPSILQGVCFESFDLEFSPDILLLEELYIKPGGFISLYSNVACVLASSNKITILFSFSVTKFCKLIYFLLKQTSLFIESFFFSCSTTTAILVKYAVQSMDKYGKFH